MVKLGSGTVTDDARGLRKATIRALAEQVTAIRRERGAEVIVVTSGAIAAGRRKLGLGGRPRTIALKQAAAAVGQTTLMRAYERAFEARGAMVGQILLTHDDFQDRKRYVNAKNTIETLLSRGIIPIVNENDTVATEEIRLGDNDRLAALLSLMIGADLLVLLTDSEGVYTRDPHRYPDARLIPFLARIDEEVMRSAGGHRVDAPGTGGMASKLAAAQRVCAFGIPVIIASGLRRKALARALAGEETGTFIAPQDKGRASSRKLWIAYARRPGGTIAVDEGARRVLLERGKSLLPAGIVAVSGTFRRGDTVSLCDRRGRVFARGIASWSSDQVARGMGKRSEEIRAIMGGQVPPEVVHRNNLAILPAARDSMQNSRTEGGPAIP